MIPLFLFLGCAVSTSASEIPVSADPGICASGAFDNIVSITCSRRSRPSTQIGPDDKYLALQIHENIYHQHFHDDDVKPDFLNWSIKPLCRKHHNETTEYCVFTDTTYASNRGVSFVTDAKYEPLIRKLPGFHNTTVWTNVNADPDHDDRYEQRQVPGKGLGLVVTRPIMRGELIFKTTATVILEDVMYKELHDDQMLPLAHAAVGRLPERTRDMFRALKGHFGGDRDVDIINTNCFGVKMFGKEGGEDIPFRAVYPEASRMNHDCRPNAHYQFDPQTLTQHVFALRTIIPGEEITVSYIDAAQVTADRKSSLMTSWGFPCGCNSCNAIDPIREASDARILEIQRLKEMLLDYTANSPITSSEMGTGAAETVLSLYKEENLLGLIVDAYTIAAIEYNSARRRWDALRYAHLAVESGLLYRGPKDPNIQDMMQLIKNAEGHWSWNYRDSQRQGAAV